MDSLNKPKEVKIAVFFSYAALVLSVFISVLAIFFDTYMNALFELLGTLFPSLIVIYTSSVIANIIFTFLCIYFASKGKNWARILLLVLLIIDLLFFLSAIDNVLIFPLIGLAEIVVIVLQVLAVVFFFKKASNGWFRVSHSPQVLHDA